MKKLLAGFAFGMMVFGIVDMASATPITTSTYNINLNLGDNSDPIYNYVWSQNINFSPAAAAVNWADLALTYEGNENTSNEFWFLSNNETSALIGNLVTSTGPVTQHFDITSLFTSFPISSITLALRLTENTSGNDKLKVDTSVITGEYTEVAQVDPSAPVPEPATMLLFGTGLAGLAAVSRRKKAC